MEEKSECAKHWAGHSGMVGSFLHVSHRNPFPNRPTWVSEPPLSYFKSNFRDLDVALNTQQSHDDYVGIICTKAVSRRVLNYIALYHLAARTSMISFKRPSRMLVTCAKSTTLCLKVPQFNLSALKTSISLMYPVIFPTSVSSFSRTP